jgi:GT2 family glycosyltransferase
MPFPSIPSRLGDSAAQLEAVSARIYIVVPVHNRKALLESYLNCMRQQTFRNFTITVVDDGSTDGTSELIREKFPEVHMLRGDGNLWWTGSINLGIRHALMQAQEHDAILINNDDIQVDPDYLDSLFHAWQAAPNALIGSLVVDRKSPEVIRDGGCIINWWTAKMVTLNTNRLLSEFHKNYCAEVSMLSGYGMLIPVHVFRKIGLFDEKHFQQCGDNELPARARKHGYRLLVSYAAIVKLHVDQAAEINTATSYSLKDLKEYFFGVRSYTRLKYRFFFSYNTATSGAAFCCFLLCDLARITFHFLRRLRFKSELNAAT